MNVFDKLKRKRRLMKMYNNNRLKEFAVREDAVIATYGKNDNLAFKLDCNMYGSANYVLTRLSPDGDSFIVIFSPKKVENIDALLEKQTDGGKK